MPTDLTRVHEMRRAIVTASLPLAPCGPARRVGTELALLLIRLEAQVGNESREIDWSSLELESQCDVEMGGLILTVRAESRAI